LASSAKAGRTSLSTRSREIFRSTSAPFSNAMRSCCGRCPGGACDCWSLNSRRRRSRCFERRFTSTSRRWNRPSSTTFAGSSIREGPGRGTQTNDSIKQPERSARRAFKPCTAPGSSAVNRSSMRPYRPSSRTISAGGRDRWSAMCCHTHTRVSCPSSARPSAEVWLKRHGKRPRGSLFPWWLAPTRRGPALWTSTFRRSRRGAYRHDCITLCASARPFACAGGRRPLPAAIAVVGQQTGRERPRPLAAPPSPARSAGSLTSCLLRSMSCLLPHGSRAS